MITLTAKVHKLGQAKEVATKAAKEIVNWLEVGKATLQSDLDTTLAQLDMNFKKGNGWQATMTRRGHYIANQYRKLDSTFSAEK